MKNGGDGEWMRVKGKEEGVREKEKDRGGGGKGKGERKREDE